MVLALRESAESGQLRGTLRNLFTSSEKCDTWVQRQQHEKKNDRCIERKKQRSGHPAGTMSIRAGSGGPTARTANLETDAKAILVFAGPAYRAASAAPKTVVTVEILPMRAWPRSRQVTCLRDARFGQKRMVGQNARQFIHIPRMPASA